MKKKNTKISKFHPKPCNKTTKKKKGALPRAKENEKSVLSEITKTEKSSLIEKMAIDVAF